MELLRWIYLEHHYMYKEFLKSLVLSGSSRSCSVKEDEQEQWVMPGQTVSSWTDTTLGNLSRHAGESGHRSGYYQHEANMRWWVKSKIKSAQEIQPALARDKAWVYLNHSSATAAGWAEMGHPSPCAECGRRSQVRLVRAIKVCWYPQKADTGIPFYLCQEHCFGDVVKM